MVEESTKPVKALKHWCGFDAGRLNRLAVEESTKPVKALKLIRAVRAHHIRAVSGREHKACQGTETACYGAAGGTCC